MRSKNSVLVKGILLASVAVPAYGAERRATITRAAMVVEKEMPTQAADTEDADTEAAYTQAAYTENAASILADPIQKLHAALLELGCVGMEVFGTETQKMQRLVDYAQGYIATLKTKADALPNIASKLAPLAAKAEEKWDVSSRDPQDQIDAYIEMITGLGLQLERLEKQASRVADTESRLAEVTGGFTQAQKDLEDKTAAVTTLTSTVAELQQALAAHVADLARIREEREAVRKQLQEANSQLETKGTEVSHHSAAVAQLQAELAQCKADHLAECQGKDAALAAETLKLQQAQAELSAQASAKDTLVAQLRAEMAKCAADHLAECQGKDAALAAETVKLQQAQTELSAQASAKDAVIAKLTSDAADLGSQLQAAAAAGADVKRLQGEVTRLEAHVASMQPAIDDAQLHLVATRAIRLKLKALQDAADLLTQAVADSRV